MWTSIVVCIIAATCSYLPPTSSNRLEYDMEFFAVPMSFTVESTVLLNDMSRRDKEVSYKLNSTLQVVPLSPPPPGASDGGHQLIYFTVIHPHLLSRGTHVNAEYMPLPSLWDSYPKSEFYSYNNNGTFTAIYVDPTEPEELINLKRSLLSLFQFSYTPDVANETDFSGTCEVQYEVMSEQVIRKVKRRCSGEEDGGAARRLSRYTRDSRGPHEVYAEEVHELHSALKARTWLRMRRAADPTNPGTAPRAPPAAFRPLPLAVPVPGVDDDETPRVEELEALVVAAGELTRGGERGGRVAAVAALRLLPALRAASPLDLAALLDRAAAAGILAEVCGALGAAGSVAGGEAVRARSPPSPRCMLTYYEGLALAGQPDENAVMSALRVGEGEGGAVSASALLAAGAAGARLSHAAVAAVRTRLLHALDRCQDEKCIASRLRALGNMRHSDDTELLLRQAAGAGPAARAALTALAVSPPHALYNITRLRRLERVAFGAGAPAERAAALELVLARGARASASLLPLMLALPVHAPPELRQLAWGRLTALAWRDLGLRALLAALPARDGGWAARALPGRSAAVEREAGGGGEWRAGLRASLLEEGGELRRAEFTLTTTARDNSTTEVMTLEVREPDAEVGVGANEWGEGPELTAIVEGVALRPRLLRDNTSELSVLRLAVDERGARSLLGGGLLRLRRRAARAVALRAEAGKMLAVRSAVAELVEARVADAWGELSASALSWATPRARLRLATGGCASVDVEPMDVLWEVRLRSALGAARRRVRRVRGARLPLPGRTVPLADPLRAVCL